MFRQMLEHASFVFEGSIGIWLSIWVIRYKAEIDEKLDAPAKAVRWGIVIAGFLVAAIPGSRFGWVRVLGYVIGLLFLCWPNFAYHIRRVFASETNAESETDS